MNLALAVVYRLAVNAIGLGAAALIFRHVAVSGFGALILAAAVLTLCNAFVKPLLTLISIPFLVLTLGLFYIIISGLVIMLVSWLVGGYYVGGLWTAIGVAFVVGLVNLLFDVFYENKSLRRVQ